MKTLKWKEEINLYCLMMEWKKRAGFQDFNSKTNMSSHYGAYGQALDSLVELVCNHHRDLNDADFSRIVRFLTDFGFELERDTKASENLLTRFRSFKYKEA